MIMHEGTAAAKKILNTQYSCFSLGVRKFGGKFPFFSKVFFEELRCSTRGVQGHVRASAAWIYYDLERDPFKHLEYILTIRRKYSGLLLVRSRSKLLASQSVEDRNARKIDLLWHCQLETHSLGKIQDFPLFNDFKSFSFLAMLQRDITKCGHLHTWKIWTCPLPVFLDLRICARCLQNLWWVCG